LEKLRIYLDNCCFNRPYDDQSELRIELETKAKLFIQNLLLVGEVNLVWSYMLDYENSKNASVQKRNVIQKWRRFAVADIDESEEIMAIARDIQSSGVKNADSLHLACAIKSGCDYFITVDDRIKYATDSITICNPLDFLSIWEELTKK
jgi:predicted nucleic acid-binding protein